MNYRNLTIHQRINFKSWRLSNGAKITPPDVNDFWDSDMMHDARLFGEYPLTTSIMKNQAATLLRKYPC